MFVGQISSNFTPCGPCFIQIRWPKTGFTGSSPELGHWDSSCQLLLALSEGGLGAFLCRNGWYPAENYNGTIYIYIWTPYIYRRRDPERGLQSWFRPAKPETRNPKPTVKVGFELRNPKPETRNRLWRLTFPRADRNPKPETRNRLWKDLPSRRPIETRNPKPKTYLPQGRSKPETRNRLWRLPQDRSKPETRNRLWRLNFPRADRNPKPEPRNPKPTAKVGFNRRNPKSETRNRQRKLVSSYETRNPKPTAKVKSTKPETRNRLESDFWVALRIGTQN